jgi:deoxyribodipyrimidine photolyase-related protein
MTYRTDPEPAAKPARTLRLVLGDQLSDGLTALGGLDPAADLVLMAEVMAEARYVRHHKQKLVLVFSAMRQFAERLRGRGAKVRYVRLDDPEHPEPGGRASPGPG